MIDPWPLLVTSGWRTVHGVRIPWSAHDWLADVGAVVAASGLGGMFLLAVLADEPRLSSQDLIAVLVVGAVALFALLLRRRWPVQFAVALIPVAMFSPVAMGVVAVAAFAVAVRRPWRVSLAVAGLYAAIVLVFFRLAESDTREYWSGVAVVLALHAAMVASGMLVRSQHLLVRSLQERARQAEEGQRLRVEEARHTERERLAREMHDVLAHRISLLAVHAGALEVRRSAPVEERNAAGVIRQCAYEALEDLREVLGMLRNGPDADDPERPQPTLTDVPALISESRRAGAHVTLDDRIGELPAIPAGVGRHVYRIVQEGLTNARKHAPGAHVHVTLDADPKVGLSVEVTNPLMRDGGAAIPGAGTGLVGLRERIDLVRGQLEHGQTPDGVFRLRAALPWRP